MSESCFRCCRPPNGTGECRPFVRWPRYPEPLTASDGTRCIHGYCSKGRCEKEVQDFIERIWQIIEKWDISYFRKFVWSFSWFSLFRVLFRFSSENVARQCGRNGDRRQFAVLDSAQLLGSSNSKLNGLPKRKKRCFEFLKTLFHICWISKGTIRQVSTDFSWNQLPWIEFSGDKDETSFLAFNTLLCIIDWG